MRLVTLAAALVVTTLATSAAGADREVAVIVNQTNQQNSMRLDELRDYFRLEPEFWRNRKKIKLARQEDDSFEQRLVVEKLYDMTMIDFKKFIKERELDPKSAPKLIRSNDQMIRFVRAYPEALGFIDAARIGNLDDTVKVVRINGKKPGQPGYPLSEK